MKKLIFILPLLYYSCTDDILQDIDTITSENNVQWSDYYLLLEVGRLNILLR